jgi:hypothetical protein
MIVGKVNAPEGNITSRCDGRHLNVPFRPIYLAGTEEAKAILAISENSSAHEVMINTRTRQLKKSSLKMGLCEGSSCGIGGQKMNDAQVNNLAKWLDDYLGS